jgi:CHAT domain-containing protein/tetratricopeptide (TPR) repeat protein
VIGFLLIGTLTAFAQAAQRGTAPLRGLAFGADTAALTSEIRRRPVEGRDLLMRLLAESMQPGAGDSALAAAHRVARGFVRAFNDSFPQATVARFERMSIAQRRAKIAADSVRRAGNSALERRGVETAIALWRTAASRSRVLGDTAGWAAATGNMGAGFYRAAELDSSEWYLRRAKQLADAVGDRVTSLNAVSILGSVATERGDLRLAVTLYEEALAKRPSVGDWRGAAADHTNLGLIAGDLGDDDGARAHFRAALNLARTHALDEPAATALLNLANLSSSTGDYHTARAEYTEALRLYRSIGHDASAAMVLHNLGLLALRRGEYADARARLQEALTVFVRAGTPEDLVQVRRDLAVVAAASGDLSGAITQLRRAEVLLAQVPDSTEVLAAIALARGDIAYQLNTFAEAEHQYARAQSLYRAARNITGETEARQGLAVMLAQRRRYAPALAQLTAVLRAQRSVEARRPAALTLVSIAEVQRRSGSADAARRSLTQALDSLRALGDPIGEAEVLSALGHLEIGAGLVLVAEEHFRRGLERVGARRVPTVLWQLHAGLARALRARGALAEAETELTRAIEDVEQLARAVPLEERRAAFLADKWQPYADQALLAHERGDAATAFLMSERMRSRQLLDMLARGRVAMPARAGDTSLISRGQDLRLRIDELTRELEDRRGSATSPLRGLDLTDSASAATRDALAAAQARYAQVMMDLRDDAGPDNLARGVPAAARDVRARLERDQALLTYLVGDSTTLVFLLSRDTVATLDIAIGRAALASLVDFARGTIEQQGTRTAGAWRAPLRRLYDHLIAPVEAAGLLDSTRRLVVVPHAELHYLPFAALVRDRNGAPDEFLIERYELAYAPSASTWLRLQSTSSGASNRRILAMAPRTNELPGSRSEVESIRELYGADATVLMSQRASERALRDSAGRYGIIHLATYGTLNQHNPLFSFVDLARGAGDDGRMEVHEVLGLNLNARLLILSACQTALASGVVSDVPAGDDWVGLVRSFLGAGAQNVIATLWAVEDRATALLMERLHRHLRAGESEASALAQAQRAMLRNTRTAGPFYWAGVALVGGQSGVSR